MIIIPRGWKTHLPVTALSSDENFTCTKLPLLVKWLSQEINLYRHRGTAEAKLEMVTLMVPIWGSAHSSLVGIITACTSGWPDNFFVDFLWQTPIPISRTLINERIRGKSRVSFLKIARMFYSWFSILYRASNAPVTLSHAYSQVSRAWRGQEEALPIPYNSIQILPPSSSSKYASYEQDESPYFFKLF